MPPSKPRNRKKTGGSDSAAAAASVLLSTAPPPPIGFEVLGIASGQAVAGINIIKDIFGAVRDIVGGYSLTYESSIKSARERALSMLQQDAIARFGGGNSISVHAVFVQFATIMDQMVVITASGTVVRPIAFPDGRI